MDDLIKVPRRYIMKSAVRQYTHTQAEPKSMKIAEKRDDVVGTPRRGSRSAALKTTGACPADNRKHLSTLSSILDLARTSVSKAR